MSEIREPPRDADRVHVGDCDLCEEHYAWDCECGNALDHYQVPRPDLPTTVTCHPCGRVYTITPEWDAWWAKNILGVPR
jgi:hypothetical protein